MVFCNLPPDSLLCHGLPIFEIYILLCWLVDWNSRVPVWWLPPPSDPGKTARMVCKNLRKYIWECFCLQMWIHFITEFLAYNWYGNFREIIAPLFPIIKELSPGLIFPFLLLPPSPTSNILPWCNKRFGYFS